MPFWAYMLHCRAGRFYVGHTDELERRVAQHKVGAFRGFIKALQPVELVWSQDFHTRIEALEAERRIKGWSRAKKLALIRGDWAEVSRLAPGKSGPSTSSERTGLEVCKSVLNSLKTAAAQAHPDEACGLLLGRDRIEQAIACANVHPDPARHFEIDPAALIAAHKAAREGGPPVAGYYHSHPTGIARPSATDRAMAAGDGRVWAIVAAETVTFWRDAADGFEALSYTLADG